MLDSKGGATAADGILLLAPPSSANAAMQAWYSCGEWTVIIRRLFLFFVRTCVVS